jgi:hypothetical protein
MKANYRENKTDWGKGSGDSRLHWIQVQIVDRHGSGMRHDAAGAELEQHPQVLKVICVGIIH